MVSTGRSATSLGAALRGSCRYPGSSRVGHAAVRPCLQWCVMRATVMYGAGDVRVENVPEPDLIERRPTHSSASPAPRSAAATCWPYKSMRADRRPAAAMGHEFIGVVEDVGADVRTVEPGDLVVAPFLWSDGTCVFCREGLHSACLHGGTVRLRRRRRRPGRGRARPAGRRHARRAPGRRRRRADAVAAHALRRDGHRPPRRGRGAASGPGEPSRSSATARSGSAA